MKIVTWNVRGVCSPSKRYGMWKSIFDSQWDILCAVEHKEHAKSGSSLHHKQYHVSYAGVTGGPYSGVMLIVRDSLKPVVVQRDVHGRFLVVEVNYEGKHIWVVGIYGSNVARQRMDLWRCLNQVLHNGKSGFLLGDFNMCSEVGQSTSMHGLMDAPEREVWDLFMMDVLRYDAWTWINGNDVGYTFQSAQYRSTWSRLDRIYIMHDDTFLPEFLTMQVYRGVGSSDHFPVVLECTHQNVDGFRSLLERQISHDETPWTLTCLVNSPNNCPITCLNLSCPRKPRRASANRCRGRRRAETGKHRIEGRSRTEPTS